MIDAVLPWVDGNDPVLAAKRAPYVSGDVLTNQAVGGSGRYASVGEIRYCVASLLRFAPFIRKIFIVTDGQDPGLGPMLRAHFPEREGDVVIVDHRVIFRGREDALPTFNSNSIDTLIWNIPDLSEQFIYLNDDFMLIRPTTPDDYFRGEKVVCYAERYPAWFERLLRWLRPGRIGYKSAMLRALELMGGGGHFINLGHAPCPMLKSWFVRWAEQRPDMVAMNLKDKFRHVDQFEAQEPFYLDMERQGRLVLIANRVAAMCFNGKDSMDYVTRKLREFNADRSRKFVCFNALNLCPEEGIAQVLAWLDERIGLDNPQ